MAGCRSPPVFRRVVLHGWPLCSPFFMRVWLHGWPLCSHAACGCAPWLVPVSFRLVLLSFLVAGRCVPVACGAS